MLNKFQKYPSPSIDVCNVTQRVQVLQRNIWVKNINLYNNNMTT